MDNTRSQSAQTDISGDKKINPKAYINSTSSGETHICRDGRLPQQRRSWCHHSRRHYCSATMSGRMQDFYASFLNVFLPINDCYQKVVYYRSFRLVHKFHRYRDYVSSKIQKIRKRVAAQMRDQTFNETKSISVIQILTKYN